MKKLVLVFVVAASLAACNNSANTASDKKDSLDSVGSAKKDRVDSTADQKKAAIDSNIKEKKVMVDKMDSAMKHDSTKR